MWLEHDIMKFGEVGRNLCGYEVTEYGLDWRIAGWEKP